MEDKAPNQYAIPAQNFPLLQEKLGKLNKIAAKLECAPIEVKILGKRTVEFWKTNPDGSEIKVVRDMIDVEVNGTAPKLAGWEFIGRIEIENGLTLMYPAPGKEIPKAFRDEPHFCDHCQTKRNRRNTYVVNKAETGDSKRVGSDCIKDFLGHKDPSAIANLLEMIREFIGGFDEEGSFGRGGWSDPMYKLEQLIPQLAAIVRVKGWVTQAQITKAMEMYGTTNLRSTRSVLSEILFPPTFTGPRARELRQEWEALVEACKPTEADTATLEPIKDSIAARNGDTDFDFNLKQLLKLDAAPIKQWGLLAAAVGMWFKDQGKLAEKAKLCNEYVPGAAVGAKLELTVKLVGVNVFEGTYGSTTLHRFRDEANRTVVWFSSKGKICNEGETLKVKGTVKALEQYKDLKQTVLTRVKEVA